MISKKTLQMQLDWALERELVSWGKVAEYQKALAEAKKRIKALEEEK